MLTPAPVMGADSISSALAGLEPFIAPATSS